MESNIHRQGVDKLPDPTSFQRRNSYNGQNPTSPQAQNIYKNNFKSIDGRQWGSQDQMIAANREAYNSMGRDSEYSSQTPESYNMQNFNKWGGD